MSETAKKQELATETNPVAIAWEHYSNQFSASTGRPTIYNAQIVARILSAIRSGQTMKQIAQNDWCPNLDTIYWWRDRHPEFSECLARARQDQAHTFADIALEAPTEALDSLKGDKSDNARVQAYRLKADVLRWRAGVQNKQYADKQTVTHEVSSDTAKLLLEARERIKTLDGEYKRVEE